MDTLDLVGRRTSVRSYDGRPVGEDLRRALLDHASSLETPFGNRARFAWVESVRSPDGKVRGPGSYGMIQGAGLWLAGATRTVPGAIEDFGYLFEGLILKAEDLGLASCWMAGTFDRSEFSEALNLVHDEVVAAVTPLGLPADKRHLQDHLAAALVRNRHRKPLKDLVRLGTSPWVEGAAGDLADALEAVRLGPSASNKQPWRLSVAPDGSVVHFYLDPTPGYNAPFEARNGFRVQELDLGIAYHHFERTLAERKVTGAWSKCDPNLSVPQGWLYSATWSRKTPS